ncbi:acyl-CoA reductase [Gordoniibacillus kamchatkensis]|uniref:acyl-CoA reductase n=1 Tax=Gordoniibacillus kamchatkensis TaxID=1590651 RepID=UPI0009E62FAD|nr:acyl-CoA reductase [Paenibacillus sp. VKM B-2647]
MNKAIKQEPLQVQAYFLPPGIEADVTVAARFDTPDGPAELLVPALNEDKLRSIADELKRRREEYLASLTTADVVERIAAAAERWLDPAYPHRQLAERLLPGLTGYAADSIRLQLKRYMRTFRKKELLRFIGEELDDPLMLDEFRPRKSGGFSRAYGPELIFHVFSGNVPGVSLWSLAMGLVARSAQLGKTSLAEPLMAVLFARSLAEIDPRLAEAIAIVPWKGGSRELESAAIASADAVVVYGGGGTVESVRAIVPAGKRFVAYGPKASVALIGREALTPDRLNGTVARLAADIAHYDQQSCMSPHCVYVEEGGSVDARSFAAYAAAELGRLQLRWPRSALTDSEAYAIHDVRNRYWLEEAEGGGAAVYASPGGTDWTVIYRDVPGFDVSPLNRTLVVYRCRSLEDDAVPALASCGREGLLQTCGVAVHPQRLFGMAERLGRIGANRLCPLGTMLQAKAGWHHDGRFNLIDLLRFADIERGTEDDAEQYDPDFE